MGNPRWSYDEMVREADRNITESMHLHPVKIHRS